MSREIINVIGYCSHCGNTTPQTVEGTLYYQGGDKDDGLYFLARCGTCQKGLLRRTECNRMIAGLRGNEDSELIWPASGDLHNCVPDKVRKCYEEAIKIKNLAPNAFANQIRRSLEAVCKEQSVPGNSLKQCLDNLASSGVIPPVQAEMSDLLRLLGNIGSHAADEEVDPKYVTVLDEFFRAIIEYVYVAPHRITEFKESLDRAKRAT
ncbi:DUF4145 domain-containing protein [Gimesia chilikensis]|uniref:DUF4145 domain-containing protein n=1 Tax=Gimesia chilikensis TaxID=2605989 RepID=UPI0011F06671|nr:DUF4145 domain-containing protein [Gimesia chilikensis]KAA0132087.1 DUF4145 domain-containing protein [Gimesia chilikensis]